MEAPETGDALERPQLPDPTLQLKCVADLVIPGLEFLTECQEVVARLFQIGREFHGGLLLADGLLGGGDQILGQFVGSSLRGVQVPLEGRHEVLVSTVRRTDNQVRLLALQYADSVVQHGQVLLVRRPVQLEDEAGDGKYAGGNPNDRPIGLKQLGDTHERRPRTRPAPCRIPEAMAAPQRGCRGFGKRRISPRRRVDATNFSKNACHVPRVHRLLVGCHDTRKRRFPGPNKRSQKGTANAKTLENPGFLGRF